MKTCQKEIVFLSHKSKDKDTARKIGKFLELRGYDIYLDENDKFLQIYAEEENKKEVVNAITIAIEKSVHLLCIVSMDTVKSWWVPFEIGIAHAKNKKIVSLRHKELSHIDLPEFLEINKMLQSKSEFLEHFREKNTLKNFFISSIERAIYDECLSNILI